MNIYINIYINVCLCACLRVYSCVCVYNNEETKYSTFKYSKTLLKV